MIDTAPKPFVFVLMPFDKKFDDIYKFGIKGAAEDAGAYAERVDEQVHDENILARVFNQIAKADVLVADMTGKNPNVFYEVGYAHALRKIVLLLTQSADDIPFDLKHRPHIVYGGEIAKLRQSLLPRIVWAIDRAKDARRASVLPPIEVAVNDVSVKRREGEAWPLVQAEAEIKTSFSLKIQVKNISGKRLEPITHWYLLTPSPCSVEPGWREMSTLGVRHWRGSDLVQQYDDHIEGSFKTRYRGLGMIEVMPTEAVDVARVELRSQGNSVVEAELLLEFLLEDGPQRFPFRFAGRWVPKVRAEDYSVGG